MCAFVNARYEILQETVSAYRREITALQERNQKMAATAQRHEHIIYTMSQDLRQTNEKLALEEVRKSIGLHEGNLKENRTLCKLLIGLKPDGLGFGEQFAKCMHACSKYDKCVSSFQLSLMFLLLCFVKARVENLTKEKEMLKQAEARLNQEKEAMLAEHRNQNLLLTNLKSIQVSDQCSFKGDTHLNAPLQSSLFLFKT